MIIRKGVRTDVEQLTDILNAVIAIGGTTAYEDPVGPDYFIRLIEGEAGAFLHVAEVKGVLAGLQWVEPLDPPDEDIGGIATFARPGGTQRGVGRALFAATLEASKQAGLRLLNAQIRADNQGGLAYYDRMGFAPYNVIPAVPLKDGTPVDRIVKRKPV